MNADHQRGVRHRRSDQSRARLVDGQPKVGHRVEVEVLEGADRRHDGAHHRQVLQLGWHPYFH